VERVILRPMRFLLVIILLLSSTSSWTQTMKIGVLRHVKTSKIEFKIIEGSYNLFGDGFRAAELSSGESVILETNTKNRVRATYKGQLLGNYNEVKITSPLRSNTVKLTNLSPKVSPREYQGDFDVTNDGALKIVNSVSMDYYLGGVVECEGGPGHTETFYMVQAIMSRTYALKYQDKHKKDGFQLCDQVHCQAYHHRQMYTPEIARAVAATNGMVITDSKNRLIDAFFYANCGGQTCDASYVWNNSISYLKPFKDTFCIRTNQARWTTKIPKEKWINFLVENYDYPIFDSTYRAKIFHFVQEERKAFFHGSALGIPLRDIRHEFKLKSTYFSCYEHEDHVVLEGYGYGHGVGLCQEGAIEMARRGYHFTQILKYYFPGIVIRLLEKSDYFQHLEKNLEDF
jgi:stage II sporulation protein D